MICSIVLGAYRASDFLKLYHAIFIYIIMKNKFKVKRKENVLNDPWQEAKEKNDNLI